MSSTWSESKPRTGASHLEACIQNCKECHLVCLEAAQTCLLVGGRHAAPEHVRLLLDCAQICQTSADFMVRSADFMIRSASVHHLICRACAEICRLCADSCRQLGSPEMQSCADVCDRCAKACAATAKAEASAH